MFRHDLLCPKNARVGKNNVLVVSSSDVSCFSLFLLQLLDENDQLIRCIAEYMQKGRAVECVQ